MRGDELLYKMELVDPVYLDAADKNPGAKKRGWLKYGTIAACLCLLIVGGISAALTSWRSGCGSQLEHNVTIVNEDMYFSRRGDGVYLYHKSSNTKEKIADFDGTFTQTAAGTFMLNNEDGAVYNVAGKEIINIGGIEPNCTLIDVISDKAYYRTYDEESGDQIIEADLTTGESKRILVAANHIKTQTIVDGKLYYYVAGADAIIMLDLASGEQKEIYRFANGGNANANNHVRFYEDVIVLQTDQGLFSMEYGDSEAIFLTEYTPITAAFDYFENQLYFIIAISLDVEGEYREALVSLDLRSKEMREVTRLTDGGMTQTYTEIAVSKDGYYYTNPSASGGLYYHYFDGRDEILISTDK